MVSQGLYGVSTGAKTQQHRKGDSSRARGLTQGDLHRQVPKRLGAVQESCGVKGHCTDHWLTKHKYPGAESGSHCTLAFSAEIC